MILRAQYPNISENSRFFVFEGIDGSGKTTQLKMLQTKLEARGYHIISTREPYDMGSGNFIRKILSGEVNSLCDAHALQALYVVARREHLHDVIIPALRRGKNTVVLCDRYIPSTFVYGMVEGMSHEEIMNLHVSILHNDFLLPDAMFFINTNPDVALTRMKERAGDAPLEYFEKKEGFMHKAAPKYLEIAQLFPDVHIVSGESDKDTVTKSIMALIEKHKLLPL